MGCYVKIINDGRDDKVTVLASVIENGQPEETQYLLAGELPLGRAQEGATVGRYVHSFMISARIGGVQRYSAPVKAKPGNQLTRVVAQWRKFFPEGETLSITYAEGPMPAEQEDGVSSI